MGEPARHDVLGQKASASRRAFEARAMSPAKALRRALSRTADVLWDLALVTQGVSTEILDQEDCIEGLNPGDLLVVLDGPAGAIGLVAVDRSMMTAMIEIQTIAQVTSMPIDDRPLTPSDAAIMAPLIDGALKRFEDNLTGHPLLPQLQGYRFGAMVEDARTAGLLLDATCYRGFRVALELAGGKRQGEMQIILPERAAAGEEVESVDPGPGRHADRLMLVPAQIEAVLCRLRLPLSRVGALKAGDLLTLPADALGRAELMAGGGHRMARGRLGQINGMRAICLTLPEGAQAKPASEPVDRAETGVSVAALNALADGAASAASAAARDVEAEDLPDLPPLEFDAGSFDAGEEDFDASALDFDSAAPDGEDFPMMAMTDFDTD